MAVVGVMEAEQTVPLAPHFIPLPVTVPDPVPILMTLTEMPLLLGVEAQAVWLSIELIEPEMALTA